MAGHRPAFFPPLFFAPSLLLIPPNELLIPRNPEVMALSLTDSVLAVTIVNSYINCKNMCKLDVSEKDASDMPHCRLKSLM